MIIALVVIVWIIAAGGIGVAEAHGAEVHGWITNFTAFLHGVLNGD